MTRTEAGAASGVSRQRWSQFEAGELTAGTLDRVLDGLGASRAERVEAAVWLTVSQLEESRMTSRHLARNARRLGVDLDDIKLLLARWGLWPVAEPSGATVWYVPSGWSIGPTGEPWPIPADDIGPRVARVSAALLADPELLDDVETYISERA